MPTIEKVKKIKEKHERELMSKAGVVGCSIGYKEIDGKRTDKLSIVCYVKEKKREEKLKRKDIIPEEIEGIPTDVVESGDFKAIMTGSDLEM
jgi:hypothetical protein